MNTEVPTPVATILADLIGKPQQPTLRLLQRLTLPSPHTFRPDPEHLRECAMCGRRPEVHGTEPVPIPPILKPEPRCEMWAHAGGTLGERCRTKIRNKGVWHECGSRVVRCLDGIPVLSARNRLARTRVPETENLPPTPVGPQGIPGGFSAHTRPKGGRPKLTPEQRRASQGRRRDQNRERMRRARQRR
jgi:hypothetical protein